MHLAPFLMVEGRESLVMLATEVKEALHERIPLPVSNTEI